MRTFRSAVTAGLKACDATMPRQLVSLVRRPHQERRTLHDAQDERRPAVVVRRRVADDLPDRRPIGVLEPPAECVGQQLLRDRARETVRGRRAAARAVPASPSIVVAAHRRAAARRPACPLRRPCASRRSRRSSRARTPADRSPSGSCCTRDSAGAAPAVRASTPAARPACSRGSCRRPEEAAAPAGRRCCSAATCRAAPATCDRDTTSSRAARPRRAARRADRGSAA